MVKGTQSGKFWLRVYDGWDEYVSAAEQAESLLGPGISPVDCTSIFDPLAATPDDPWFAGCKSTADAVNKARQGWDEVISGLKPAAFGVVASSKKRRSRVMSEDDGELNVDRMLEGSEKPFDSWLRQQMPDQTITLAFAPVRSAGVPAAVYIEAAQQMVSMAEYAELQGFQVEVVAVFGGTGCYNGLRIEGIPAHEATVVPIKRVGEFVNPAALAACAHPSAHRRLSWRIRYSKEGCPSSNRGGAAPYTDAEVQQVIDLAYPGQSKKVVVLSGSGLTNEERVKRAMAETVDELSIPPSYN